MLLDSFVVFPATMFGVGRWLFDDVWRVLLIPDILGAVVLRQRHRYTIVEFAAPIQDPVFEKVSDDGGPREGVRGGGNSRPSHSYRLAGWRARAPTAAPIGSDYQPLPFAAQISRMAYFTDKGYERPSIHGELSEQRARVVTNRPRETEREKLCKIQRPAPAKLSQQPSAFMPIGAHGGALEVVSRETVKRIRTARQFASSLRYEARILVHRRRSRAVDGCQSIPLDATAPAARRRPPRKGKSRKTKQQVI